MLELFYRRRASARYPFPALLLGWIFSALFSPACLAWSNHTLATREALAALPELRGRQVKAEPLEAFLASQDAALEKLLADEEAWARREVPHYPPRPDALAWRSGGSATDRRARFMAALRINPALPLPLFIQLPAGASPGKQRLPWQAVTTLKQDGVLALTALQKVGAGRTAKVLDVVASAADEPDYGMDLGLWDDNGTAYGARYGFGPQPFGNPAVEFSSQAPFHMGFYHEAPIVYTLAGFLQRTYPEYRINLFQTLARHAFRTGHEYWGWRFAGWALHYLGDLTQPYHARVLPGISLPWMLWINGLDAAGAVQAKREVITRVTNRHLVYESFQHDSLRAALLAPAADDAVLRRLRDASADDRRAYDTTTPREAIARRADARADRLDAVIEAAFPPRLTSDPSFEAGADDANVDLAAAMRQAPPVARQALDAVTIELLGNFAEETRRFIRTLRQGLPVR